MKLNNTLLLTLLAASLSACGGGGGSDSGAAPVVASVPPPVVTPPVTANPGNVSAKFVKSDNARFVLFSGGTQLVNKLNTFTQDANGGLTEISGNTLTGSAVIKDISGDAHYAQGRWAAGSVTLGSAATQQFSGNGNESAYYVALNSLAALPVNGTLTCDAGKFTAPAYSSGAAGSGGVNFGTATGSATLSFDANGAHAGVTFNISAGTNSGTTTLAADLTNPNTSSFKGNFLSNGTGGMLTLGDGGSGAVMLFGAYRAALSNGNTYTGTAAFRCS